MTRPWCRAWRVPLTALLMLSGSLLAGCASHYETRRLSIKDTVAMPPTASAPRETAAPHPMPRQQRAQSVQIDGGEGCRDVQSCDGLLRALVESRDRSWIIRPPTPQAQVTGVRMLAYRVLRPRLTCGELAVGIEELRSAPNALATPPTGSNPEEVAGAIALAAKVQEELRAERDARCKPALPPAEQPQPPPAQTPPPSSSAPGQPQAPATTSGQPSGSSPQGQPQSPPATGQPERRPEQ